MSARRRKPRVPECPNVCLGEILQIGPNDCALNLFEAVDGRAVFRKAFRVRPEGIPVLMGVVRRIIL